MANIGRLAWAIASAIVLAAVGQVEQQIERFDFVDGLAAKVRYACIRWLKRTIARQVAFVVRCRMFLSLQSNDPGQIEGGDDHEYGYGFDDGDDEDIAVGLAVRQAGHCQ